MAAMSRRAMLTNILPGAVVAVAGVGTIGWAVAPEVADAMPLAIAKGNHVKVDDLAVKAQVVVVQSEPSSRSPSPALGLLVAQGTSPLRLAVGVVAFFLAVVSVTSGGSDRRQGGEAARGARLLVAAPFLPREYRCT